MPDPKERTPEINTHTPAVVPAKPDKQPHGDAKREPRAYERAPVEAPTKSAKPAQPEAPPSDATAELRAFFARLNQEEVFARLPRRLRTNTVRDAIREIMAVVAGEIDGPAKPPSDPRRGYKTVDRTGNIRNIAPGQPTAAPVPRRTR